MSSPHLIRNDLDGPDLPLIERGEGSWLIDAEGRRYLDAASGAVVVSIGHAHPRVVRAVADQVARVSFTHRGAFGSKALDTLADRLCELTGYDGAWFVNSGSEAVEAAMQFVLQFHAECGRPERVWFLSPTIGYNGNTLGGLSLSGHARRAVVRELAYDFNTLPAPYAFRDANGLSESEYSDQLLRDARRSFEAHRGHIAGVVIEPIGGATAGCLVPPRGYLPGLKALCVEYGALMIVDEVMTGLGRAGWPMASDQFGVVPDIAVVGKGLGAGYAPIAAVLVRQEIIEAIRAGSGRVHGGHTYAGNPLSVAAALAVLDVLQAESVPERSVTTAKRLEGILLGLATRHPIIADVRGLGMMRAIELRESTDGAGAAPGGLSAELFRTAMDEGVVIYPASGGVNDSVLVCPPLTICAEDLDFLETGLDRALTRTAASLESRTLERARDRSMS